MTKEERQVLQGKIAEGPVKTVILNTLDLAEISECLGRNISSRGDLLAALRSITTVTIEGSGVTLEPYLLNRLKSRCHTPDFPGFLRRVIVEQLAGYCGC